MSQSKPSFKSHSPFSSMQEEKKGLFLALPTSSSFFSRSWGKSTHVNSQPSPVNIILRPSSSTPTSSYMGRSPILGNWFRNPLEQLKRRAIHTDRAGSSSVIKYQKPKEFKFQFMQLPKNCYCFSVVQIVFQSGSVTLSIHQVKSLEDLYLACQSKVDTFIICCSKEILDSPVLIHLQSSLISNMKYLQETSKVVPKQKTVKKSIKKDEVPLGLGLDDLKTIKSPEIPSVTTNATTLLPIMPQKIPLNQIMPTHSSSTSVIKVYDTHEPWVMESEQREIINPSSFYYETEEEDIDHDCSSANGEEIEEDPMNSKAALLRLAKETLDYIQSHRGAADELNQLKPKLYSYCSSNQTF
ncbi:uncharacterized protein RHIMIDRAFT_244810 [Rhizopus microsporus ATCC 52813]|uniref:Uncharacterized protein n=1 Tax=Rhizopus microsporus ATCC 52813 TaxID=1340429 RepID=A0A2G4SQ97_RHIZD|nr:uncharacterized protein RHIMIDRAFT_244810 [Rhizopus microsporus ATCC 52813]PHZ10944.1 hypothetical protein RHIMIDRAFT_244810 [Rhizopus microsporus ATCC 52813]